MSLEDAITVTVSARLASRLAQSDALREALDECEVAERAAMARSVERAALESIGQSGRPTTALTLVAGERR